MGIEWDVIWTRDSPSGGDAEGGNLDGSEKCPRHHLVLSDAVLLTDAGDSLDLLLELFQTFDILTIQKME